MIKFGESILKCRESQDKLHTKCDDPANVKNINIISFRRAINIMGLLVLQAVCVQPFLYFIQASLWANDNTVLSEVRSYFFSGKKNAPNVLFCSLTLSLQMSLTVLICAISIDALWVGMNFKMTDFCIP